MSEIIVGDSECPVVDVVRVLASLPDFAQFHAHLPDIALDIGLSPEAIEKLNRDKLAENINLKEQIHYMLVEWVAANGKNATLQVLMDILKRHAMIKIAESLVNTFISKLDGIENPSQSNVKNIISNFNRLSEVKILRERSKNVIFPVKNYISRRIQTRNVVSHDILQGNYILLDEDTSKLRWINSYRRVNGIFKFVEKSKFQDSLTEDEFLNHVDNNLNQTVLICDSYGMGKSVLLSKFAEILMDKYLERVVLFFNMTQLMNEVNREKITKDSIKSALITLNCSNTLEEKRLYSILNLDTNTIFIELMVDSFNEIDSSDLDIALDILKVIQSFKSVRLWVASRQHLDQVLENTLCVLGFSMQLFDFEDQVNYLVGHWALEKGEENVDQQKLEEYARHCLHNFHSTSNSNSTGDPLKFLLIGELYKADALDYAVHGRNVAFPDFDEIYSISTLYGHLAKRRIDKEEEIMDHFKLSLNVIFPRYSYFWNEVIHRSVDKEEITKVGIVSFIEKSDTPAFIHRTFAEYFVAWFFADWLKGESVDGKVEEKIMEFILKEIFRVCESFCTILGKECESFLFWNYAICRFFDEKVKNFESTQKLKSLFKKYIKAQHLNGITHSCTNSKFLNILEVLHKLEVLKEQSFDFNLTAMAMLNSVDMFAFLITKECATLTLTDDNNNTLLHAAAAYGKLEAVVFIIEKGAILNARNKDGSTPLHIAALNENGKFIEILKVLIEAGSDVYALDKKKRTFLHLLSKNDFLSPSKFYEFVEFLVDRKLGKLFNAQGCGNNTTPMQWLICKIEVEEKTLKLLYSSGVDFNYVNTSGGSLLTFALLGGRSTKCLSSLINFGVDVRHEDNNKAGFLHLSCELGNIEAAGLFLDQGLDINAVDGIRNTPLHGAVQFNTRKILEFTKLLVDNGADVRAKNSEGFTPLGIIIRREISVDLKFRLAEMLGVSFENPFATISPIKPDEFIMEIKVDPAHAIELKAFHFEEDEPNFSSIFNMIKCLIESGADPYAKDKNNWTFLHRIVLSGLCTSSQFDEIAQYLTEQGNANLFNYPGGPIGVTPLKLAMERLDINKDTIKFLRSAVADVDKSKQERKSLIARLKSFSTKGPSQSQDTVRGNTRRNYLEQQRPEIALNCAAVTSNQERLDNTNLQAGLKPRSRGKAVIFSHTEFSKGQQSHHAMQVDEKSLEICLVSLGFTAILYKDIQKQKMMGILENLQKDDHSDKECLMIIVLSHGQKEKIFCKDGEYRLEDLLDFFKADKCPSLAGKPKIVIIQACRYYLLDDGTMHRERAFDILGCEQEEIYVDQNKPDFLVVYIAPDYYTCRRMKYGSPFIHSVVNILSTCEDTGDMLSLITTAAQNVVLDIESETPKQHVMIASRMTREMFLFVIRPVMSVTRGGRMCCSAS